MRRALLVLLVGWVASVALAQPGAAAVRQTARTWTEEQILANVTGNNVVRPVNWGRVIRYGGNVILAAGLIYTALEWFYDQAQASTGTELDDWYAATQGMPRVPPDPAMCVGYVVGRCVGFYESETRYWVMGWVGGFRKGVKPASGARIGYYPAQVERWDLVAGGWEKAGSGTPIPYWWTTTVDWYGQHNDEDHYDGEADVGRLLRANSTNICGVVPATWWGFQQCVVAEWGPAIGDPGVGPLDELLGNYPGAMGSVRNRIVPDYLQAQEESGVWPYTYGEPYGPGSGVTVEPSPNQNQWYDNPYANPSLDTDGDGWPDWKEVVAGTDPNDADSYPTVDPDPEPEPGQDPEPDSDGDGIPDKWDPCPYDALNRCADVEPEELEIPDDYAREPTLQGIAIDAGTLVEQGAHIRTATERTADAAEEIRDLLDGEGELVGEAVMPELEAAWSGVIARMESSLAAVRSAAEGKVGFNAGSLIPQLTAAGGGSCEEITITLLGITRPLGWCGSSFYTLVTTWGRNGIALLMLIGFAFASARTVGAL